MEINTLHTGFLVGVTMVAALAVLCMARAGRLTALCLALSPVRAWLADRLFTREERSQDEAKTALDRTDRHRVKEPGRLTRPVITLHL